jgi:hypothetical protein
MTKTTSKKEEKTAKASVQTLAENEYLKNGVLYRNDLRVGEDGGAFRSPERRAAHRVGA